MADFIPPPLFPSANTESNEAEAGTIIIHDPDPDTVSPPPPDHKYNPGDWEIKPNTPLNSDTVPASDDVNTAGSNSAQNPPQPASTTTDTAQGDVRSPGVKEDDVPPENKDTAGGDTGPTASCASLSDPSDLMHYVKGMYRILDLISETGSGGLVEKVIIDQKSLKCFINKVSPGAYASLTKVDFRALDSANVKPVGVYGSKEKIVDLLLEIGAIEPQLMNVLLENRGGSGTPHLRSGIYFIQPSPSLDDDPRLYVVYWPEETTWDDNAVSSVKRNRVTFMRYLTKIVDQLYCLISSDHASSLAWAGDVLDELEIDEDDQGDRLFSFEVTKTNEQEENVVPRPGITVDISMLFPKPTVTGDQQTNAVFLSGERKQAIRTSALIPPTKRVDEINKDIFQAQLKNVLTKYSIELSRDLDDAAVSLLIENGLDMKFPTICDTWKTQNAKNKEMTRKSVFEGKQLADKRLNDDKPLVENALTREIITRILGISSLLNPEEFSPGTNGVDMENSTADSTSVANLLALFPQLNSELDSALKDAVGRIPASSFQRSRDRVIIAEFFFHKSPDLSANDRKKLADLIRDSSDSKELRTRLKDWESPTTGGLSSIWSGITSLFASKESSPGINEAVRKGREIGDWRFLTALQEKVSKEPLLERLAQDVVKEAHIHLQEFIRSRLPRLHSGAHDIMRGWTHHQVEAQEKDQDQKRRTLSRNVWFDAINMAQAPVVPGPQDVVFVRNVEEVKHGWAQTRYKFVADITKYSPALLEYKVHSLSLTSDSRQDLQLNPQSIPSLHIDTRFSYQFCLPAQHTILHLQLLENEKLLLIVDDHHDGILVYLDSQQGIKTAVDRPPQKSLHRSKIGEACTFTFDEMRRTLAICETTKLQLHIFIFDEQYNQLQSWASGIELAPWYSPGVSITAMCFVHGSEELLLIDTDLVAKIYSLLTQQFRPASVSLDQSPAGVHSTPDGACLLLSFVVGSKVILKAYHWATFGSTDGIVVACPENFAEPLLVTSMVNRASVHVMTLDSTNKLCSSLALDITKKITDFTFREYGETGLLRGKSENTLHNCLIDCHEDVWTRFPVLAAIQHQTILSSHGRCPPKLVFVVDGKEHHQLVGPHFSEMKHRFHQTTHKPLSNDLKNMEATAQEFDQFLHSQDWDKSTFHVGEWLVNIICLIPIHIAVTRDNIFLPLKDGISSVDHENSLLGAEVSHIVNTISLGWYESIFQSYMAQKAVKVVSSMGEQSVGKSFALNHLVDTSFAGSAMRTTEGVWLSVTPTEDYLVVALDFEGVHSIERSAQEDTLLVLFNTAISNMVLFRNNFALSRDITGLFQSFQSSSTVLDPASNPTLFQSKLMIIIKDVVDADKKDIVREFSLKFQKIVQDEQDSNFITKLHRGKLDIIPWPVIGSKQFYMLFPAIQKRLDQQEVTHKTAGEFLQTLKTLMAKLKANDWGALSQNLVAHRVLLLLDILPKAVSLGMSDADEPLKDLDTNEPTDTPDTGIQFYLSGQSGDKEATLYALCKSWNEFPNRFNVPENDWISGLSGYLETITQMRAAHVQEWIHQNLDRFKASHASLETLKRACDTALVELRENVRLCKAQCPSCNLLCLQSRGHETQHDCKTSHECPHMCGFGGEHPDEEKKCGFSAGHSGQHVCAVDVHLCGEPCKLKDKKGCQGECTKLSDHKDNEHVCSARVHACGEPCELRDVPLPSQSGHYSCDGTCSIASDEVHDKHTCDKRMCPMPCQLCKRLCSNMDHLHGLKKGEIHLCEMKHPCTKLCKAQGTCDIETTPQSIESTFTGRHESFQYTKYSQVAKRLPCVIPIPEGKLEHPGDHCHSSDSNVFHHCESRCENCGYYCTLPIGHPQREHETSHGSMSRVKWSVEGSDDTAFEVNGHKFATNDDGAPMMCNLYCADLGRHVHVDYCRSANPTACSGAEVQHLSTRVRPNPEKPKDWITHGLHWKRMGFKDPYSKDDQTRFAKCDHMCSGPEHQATATNPAHPSYCTLPMFHPPASANQATGLGYVSNDGHVFTCRNPVVMRQAFHVIFVIDRSGSMSSSDLRPLPNTPVTPKISRCNNNRLGAVYSSLHGFWVSRHAALNAVGQNAAIARRDAYSVILFDNSAATCMSNDFARSPDELLDSIVAQRAGGGTNYTGALTQAQSVMIQHWSNERAPILIFLSDGECSVADATVRSICRAAIDRGKPLSFHAVSFGPHNEVLRRMAQVAKEVEATAPRDPLLPPDAHVESSYSTALDSVRLAETFLGLANSLRKTRGSLIR